MKLPSIILKTCPHVSFSVQLLEKLPGNGYKDGEVDKPTLKYRLEREDHWIKTLRTIYPYVLNERSNVPIGKLLSIFFKTWF